MASTNKTSPSYSCNRLQQGTFLFYREWHADRICRSVAGLCASRKCSHVFPNVRQYKRRLYARYTLHFTLVALLMRGETVSSAIDRPSAGTYDSCAVSPATSTPATPRTHNSQQQLRGSLAFVAQNTAHSTLFAQRNARSATTGSLRAARSRSRLLRSREPPRNLRAIYASKKISMMDLCGKRIALLALKFTQRFAPRKLLA